MKAKIGDKIQIIALAPDSDGTPDPRADEYAGKTGIVESIDGIGALHGTWGSLGILPEDRYMIVSDV